MKKAIATVCMSGALADKLAAAAAAGYGGVEIFENDLTYFDGSPEDVRALAASLGLEILALQPFRDFEGLPEPLRGRAFDRARRKLELMNRLGTSPAAGLQQRLAGRDRRPGAGRRRPARAGRAGAGRTASPSVSRPCAGAGTSTTTGRPGRRCARPTIPGSG